MTLDLNSLDLEISGAPKKPLVIEEVCEVELADLTKLMSARDTKPPALVKLRDRHHALAKMLASGMSEGEAGIACGYTPSRVSILKNDPSFQDLLAHYRGNATDRHFDRADLMEALSRDVIEELSDRLENDPDSFTINQLESLAKTFADRTGMGPSSKTEVNVKVGLGSRFEAAQKRAAAQRHPMIDITPEGDAA